MQNTLGRVDTKQASGTHRDFKVWKTIKLGTGSRNSDDFQKAIYEAGCSISDWGSSILYDPAFTVSHEVVEYDLIIASVADLGFNESAKVRDIYERAIELGLELCLIELGPRLCMEGEECYLGMEPVIDSACNGDVFFVSRGADGKHRLRGEYCNLSDSFNPDKSLVFMKRK